MNAPEQSGEPITAAGIEDLKPSSRSSKARAGMEMAARIKVAREEGDLKENAEYHIAKEDQAHLETRIKRLQERLRNAVVVEVDASAADSFAFGRTAEVLDEANGESQRLDPGRLDRGQPRRGPPLRRVADRAGADGRRGRRHVKVETPRGTKAFKVIKLVS